jgi:hypothetical protein
VSERVSSLDEKFVGKVLIPEFLGEKIWQPLGQRFISPCFSDTVTK